MEGKIQGQGKSLTSFFGFTLAGVALGLSLFYVKQKVQAKKKPFLIDRQTQAEFEQVYDFSFGRAEVETKTPQLISEASPLMEISRDLDERKVAQICMKVSREIKDQLTELRQKYSNDTGYLNNSKSQRPLYQLEEEMIENQIAQFCENQSLDHQKLNNFIKSMDNQKFFNELLQISKKSGIYIRLLEIEEIQEIIDYYLQQLQIAETQNPDLDQQGLMHQAELKMRLKYGVFQDMLIFMCKSLQVVCGIDDQVLSKQVLKIDKNFRERGFLQSIIIILSIMNSIS